jgi:hypothetical protein
MHIKNLLLTSLFWFALASKLLPYPHFVHLPACGPGLVPRELFPNGQYWIAVHGPFRCVTCHRLDEWLIWAVSRAVIFCISPYCPTRWTRTRAAFTSHSMVGSGYWTRYALFFVYAARTIESLVSWLCLFYSNTCVSIKSYWLSR